MSRRKKPPPTGYVHPSGHGHHLGADDARVARALALLEAVDAITAADRYVYIDSVPVGGWQARCRGLRVESGSLPGVLLALAKELP